MDREAWRTTVHEVTKSQIGLSDEKQQQQWCGEYSSREETEMNQVANIVLRGTQVLVGCGHYTRS